MSWEFLCTLHVDPRPQSNSCPPPCTLTYRISIVKLFSVYSCFNFYGTLSHGHMQIYVKLILAIILCINYPRYVVIITITMFSMFPQCCVHVFTITLNCLHTTLCLSMTISIKKMKVQCSAWSDSHMKVIQKGCRLLLIVLIKYFLGKHDNIHVLYEALCISVCVCFHFPSILLGVRDGYNYFFGSIHCFIVAIDVALPLEPGSILWFCDFRHFPHPFSLKRYAQRWRLVGEEDLHGVSLPLPAHGTVRHLFGTAGARTDVAAGNDGHLQRGVHAHDTHSLIADPSTSTSSRGRGLNREQVI